MSRRDNAVSRLLATAKISLGDIARPALASIRVANATFTDFYGPSIPLHDGKNVVFEMHVLMQVGLEFSEGLEQGPIADADIDRCGEPGVNLPHFLERRTRGIVLHHHYANGILDTSES